MKPKFSIRPFLTVVFFSIALMSASMVANADNNRNNKSHKSNNHKEYRDDRNNGSYHSDNRNNWNKGNNKHYGEQKYDRNKYSRHDYRDQDNYRNEYYNHPKYGRVYSRFDHNPTIFRHSNQNYYYSQNRFYTYHDGIGYCVTDAPRNVYFRELPFQCTRIYSNGREYYRNGDLYFSLSNRGYIIVPAPIEVSLSVRF